MEEENCGNCRYFFDYGQCRRHAPRTKCCNHADEFPRVSRFDWCGDWEKKVEEKDD